MRKQRLKSSNGVSSTTSGTAHLAPEEGIGVSPALTAEEAAPLAGRAAPADVVGDYRGRTELLVCKATPTNLQKMDDLTWR